MKKYKIALSMLVVALSIIVIFIQYTTKLSFEAIERDLKKATSKDTKLIKNIEVGNNEFALYKDDNRLGLMKYSELIFGRYKRYGGVSFDDTQNTIVTTSSKAKSSCIVLFGANKDSKIDSIEVKVNGKSKGYEDKTIKFKLLKENYFVMSTEVKGDVQSITVYDANNKDITQDYLR